MSDLFTLINGEAANIKSSLVWPDELMIYHTQDELMIYHTQDELMIYHTQDELMIYHTQDQHIN